MKIVIIKSLIISCLLIILFVLFEGCSGCSRSGLKNRASRNSERKSENSYVEPEKDTQARNSPNTKPKTSKSNSSGASLTALFKKCKPAVFMIYTSDGQNYFQGSGFFVSSDGIAVSNFHVFEGTSIGKETIKLESGRELKIEKVLAKSRDDDYIIFKVKLSGFYISNPIPISFNEPLIGEDVFAIGNPRGLESTLSKGIISGFRDNRQYIQTTTEITHGSSGGPLLNMRGEVVGITTAGLGEANLNFAVNIKHLPLQNYNLNN